MAERKKTLPTAAPFLPAERTIAAMSRAVQDCRGCDLYRAATQAVFGEGPGRAEIVFVGEQPGDAEDRAGRPFVGPAGKVFDRALEQAGIERQRTYVTNAVKHFSFEQRGKARLHKRPRPGEVRACSPWLEEELRTMKPKAVVLMGATAAQAIFGSAFRVTEQRGQPLESELAPLVIATIHPSAVLRAVDHDAREAAFAQLAADLTLVRKTVAAKPKGRSTRSR